jgi:hypothetical protein
MKKTIIVGTIEFLNRKVIVHSVDEVYQADTKEELEALQDTFEQEGKDYLVVEWWNGEIEITPSGLLGLIWGSNKPSITNNAIPIGGGGII